jgi:hypothetical protein
LTDTLVDRDPRDVILQIDGVEYKFKDNVKHTTNKRFVGYIAQQIESVVPEAVQLIDGILHVDYESLIPYLSESIKQNFNDIKGLKSESEQIRKVLDLLYAEFLTKHPNYGVSTKKSASGVTRGTARRCTKWLVLLATGLVCFIGAAVSVFLLLTAQTPIVVGQPTQTNNTVIDSRDKAVLMVLFDELNGPNWHRKDGWGSNTHYCEWQGIVCVNNRVAIIRLGNNNLVGTIPGNIGDLDQLQSVNMALNDLQGTIPTAFWFPRHLEDINLSQNKNLQGPLPYQLVAAHPTLSLDLSGCNIQGTIPPSLMHDFNYELLNLSSNALTGTLTATAPNRSIRSLDLSYNQLTGSIPRLIVMQDLILSHNRLTNNLAEIKYSYSILKVLDVSHNELDGELVLDDDDDIRLNYFDISHNRFNSSTLLLKFPALKYCDASNNDFKCPIAIWLTTECNAVCHN